MCGIVGIVPVPGKEIDIKTFNNMTALSRKRGLHASGYLVYNGPNDFCVIKEPGFFLHLDPENNDFKNAKLILGHVRKASMGSFSDNEGNHPHRINNLVLVHNGTAPTLARICRDLKISNPTGNDSLAMLHLIYRCTRNGMTVPQAIDAVLSQTNVNDSFSIAVFDLNTGDLFFCRDARNNAYSGRPLVLSANKDGLVFASEESFIAKTFGGYIRRFGLYFRGIIDSSSRSIIQCNVNDINLNPCNVVGRVQDTPANIPCLMTEEQKRKARAEKSEVKTFIGL